MLNIVEVIRSIYKHRSLLFFASIALFVLMLMLSVLWTQEYKGINYEPFIVFIGFVTTIIQLTPQAIVTSFPHVRYDLNFRLGSLDLFTIEGKTIAGIKAIEYPLDPNAIRNAHTLSLIIKNKSDIPVHINKVMLAVGENAPGDLAKGNFGFIEVRGVPASNEVIVLQPGEEQSIPISQNALKMIRNTKRGYISFIDKYNFPISKEIITLLNQANEHLQQQGLSHDSQGRINGG